MQRILVVEEFLEVFWSRY